ncbi:hypothetical protein BC937DRAFT_86178 [Endogone sp. FLAS-F59071]|nr:hypothetical protein BC937DRAFT_86178 [Endogone sp. FLAS-F59071]|eukprot:RUS20205.1 hypothetical protein BC937DRAFT_86178 [Endogone sp. FLAS-F59071]
MNALKHAASIRKFSAARSTNLAIRPTSTRLVVAPLASSFSRAAFSPRLGRSYATTPIFEAIENKDPYIPPASTPTPPTPTPSAILEASLTFVPTFGWTIESLARGAESMGYPSVAHGMFPNGAADLIDYFLEQSRRHMVRELQEGGRLGSLRTHDKIQLACTVRLNLMRPYIKQWPEVGSLHYLFSRFGSSLQFLCTHNTQALAIIGQPKNMPMSLEHLGKLVDDMWFLAGDRSADVGLSFTTIAGDDRDRNELVLGLWKRLFIRDTLVFSLFYFIFGALPCFCYDLLALFPSTQPKIFPITKMNWYTKRASLAAVYTSTGTLPDRSGSHNPIAELYMTQDQSPEYIETFKFLDRRLGDVATVGKGITEFEPPFEIHTKLQLRCQAYFAN